MVKKLILCSLMFLFSLPLVSCSDKMDVDAFMNEFSKFPKNDEMALTYCYSYLYYKNQVIDLENIPGVKGDASYGDLIVKEDKIYFSTYEESSLVKKGHLYVYEYDLNTEELILKLTKDEFKTAVRSFTKNQCFYFRYISEPFSNYCIVDQYNILTGEYSTFLEGEDAEKKLNEFLNQKNFTYKRSNNRDKLSFENKSTKKTYEVNRDILEKTPEGKMLNQYQWMVWGTYEFYNDVYISFFISDNDFWNTKYFTIVFKYNLDTESLSFQNIYYLGDFDDSQIYLSLR